MFELLRTALRRMVQSPTQRSPMPKPGQDAPDFELLAHTGERIRLKDQRGKRVVLWFYPKADTPG